MSHNIIISGDSSSDLLSDLLRASLLKARQQQISGSSFGGSSFGGGVTAAGSNSGIINNTNNNFLGRWLHNSLYVAKFVYGHDYSCQYLLQSGCLKEKKT